MTNLMRNIRFSLRMVLKNSGLTAAVI